MATFTQINWPPDHGCVSGTKEKDTLKEGQLVDRFGDDTGYFLGDAGDYYVYRSLPYFGSLDNNAVKKDLNQIRNDYIRKYNENTLKHNPAYNYKQYRVLKQFDVEKCKIASWFGFEGQATQYRTFRSISDLVTNQFLIPETHSYPPFFDKEHEKYHKKPVTGTTGGKKKKRYSRTRNKRRLTRARKSRKVFRKKRI